MADEDPEVSEMDAEKLREYARLNTPDVPAKHRRPVKPHWHDVI